METKRRRSASKTGPQKKIVTTTGTIEITPMAHTEKITTPTKEETKVIVPEPSAELKPSPTQVALTAEELEELRERQRTFNSLISDGRITVTDKLRMSRFRPYSQGVLSVIILGTLAYIFGTGGLLAANFDHRNFSLDGLFATLLMGLIIFGGLSVVAMVIVIFATHEHNRQLRLQLEQITAQFNQRYRMELDYYDTYELIQSFRIPVNIDEQRSDIRLTTLRCGRDARLVYSGTGKELPFKSEIAL